MSNSLIPRDHAEAVALFRAGVIGALTRRVLGRGELATELRTLAERKYRPPGRRATKQYGISTLDQCELLLAALSAHWKVLATGIPDECDCPVQHDGDDIPF